MAKRWLLLVGVFSASFGCGSEKASNEDGGGTSSGGSVTGGQSGSGAGSGGSGGSYYIRYTMDGTTVEVDPYMVTAQNDILDIISHELLGATPSFRLIIGWGRGGNRGTFACAREPLEPGSTTMEYGYQVGGSGWLSYVKEGTCEVVVATETLLGRFGEATGTFSGMLYHRDDEPPKAVTNGSFDVRYELGP
jgi:hypothetical protein